MPLGKFLINNFKTNISSLEFCFTQQNGRWSKYALGKQLGDGGRGVRCKKNQIWVVFLFIYFKHLFRWWLGVENILRMQSYESFNGTDIFWRIATEKFIVHVFSLSYTYYQLLIGISFLSEIFLEFFFPWNKKFKLELEQLITLR